MPLLRRHVDRVLYPIEFSLGVEARNLGAAYGGKHS